jgi:phage replication O-like protein O
MTKGQLPDKDYFKVKNDWWEALVRCKIPGNQWQCVMHIIRKTYGWQIKECEIPMNSFVDATGIKKPHVSRALKMLKQRKIIIVTHDGNSKHLTYSFNKYFDQWGVHIPRVVTQDGNGVVVTQDGNDTLPRMVTINTQDGNSKPILPISIKDTRKTLKDTNVASPKLQDFDMRSLPYLLSETLLSRIKINIPDFKPAQNSHKETTLQRWSVDIEKMIRIDKRQPCHIWNMILWIQDTETGTGEFWFKNILSGKKLRKQYDKLSASITADVRKKDRNKSQNDKLMEVGARWLKKQETQDS